MPLKDVLPMLIVPGWQNGITGITLYYLPGRATHLTRLVIPLHHGCMSGRRPPWIELCRRCPKKDGQMFTGHCISGSCGRCLAPIVSSMLHVASCSYFFSRWNRQRQGFKTACQQLHVTKWEKQCTSTTCIAFAWTHFQQSLLWHHITDGWVKKNIFDL